MTAEKQKIFDLLSSLEETLEKIKEVYGNSAYYIHIDYQAEHNKIDNWLFRAREVIKDAEKHLTKIA